MDRTQHHLTTDSIPTCGGLADRDTVIWPEPLLWDDDDCILGCSAPAAVMPRALGFQGDLTEESVVLAGAAVGAYPVPASLAQLSAR